MIGNPLNSQTLFPTNHDYKTTTTISVRGDLSDIKQGALPLPQTRVDPGCLLLEEAISSKAPGPSDPVAVFLIINHSQYVLA